VEGDAGCLMMVRSPLAGHLAASLTSVRTVPVTVEEVPLAEVEVPPPRERAVRTTEASMRVDAVASAGFGMSRSKMTAEIQAGHVRLNWRAVRKPSAEVREGDVLSVDGRGRVEVRRVGETARGRFALELARLL